MNKVSTMVTKVLSATIVFGATAGAIYAAWWAWRLVVYAVVPGIITTREHNAPLNIGAFLFYAIACTVCFLCCRVAWLFLKVLQQPSANLRSLFAFRKARVF